jgi:hypothetical protein
MVNNGPRYHLTLCPRRSDIPIAQRLRALLKYALRSCNLQCVSVEELPPEEKRRHQTGPQATGQHDSPA